TMGALARSVSVSLAASVLLLSPLVAAAQDVTALVIDSQPGDFIGQGEKVTYTPAAGVTFDFRWQTSAAGPSFVSRFIQNSSLISWSIDRDADGRGLPVPGVYEMARRWPFTTLNAMDVSGHGRGCNAITGRFVVYEADYAPDGSVRHFAADFEQHCED